MTARSIGILCFPTHGGSGVVASELAMGLAGRGHTVHLFSTALPPRADEQVLRFHRIDVPGYPLLEQAPYGFAAASKMIDVGRSEGLDLIAVHYGIPHAASGFLARAALGDRAPLLVTWLHGSDVTHLGGMADYRSALQATVLASDGLVVPSEFLKREAYRQLALPPDRAIEVIPNFVDTERFVPFAPRESVPVLCHVSNFRPVKRIGALLEVFAHVRRQRPARLNLIGDGPDRLFAERHAATLGIAADVRFLGDRTDFIPVLCASDAFLLTSESESFGLAALEAMSAGVPVFAFRVGGLPEVVTPDAGVLTEPRVEVLGDALLQALATPGRLAAMGAAARRRAVAHFQKEPALDRCEAYFLSLLSARAGA